jgi:hypothetical protein
MRPTCTACKLLIGAQLMSVLCCDIKIRYLRGYFSKRVCLRRRPCNLTIADSRRHRCPGRAASEDWKPFARTNPCASKHGTATYRSESHHEQAQPGTTDKLKHCTQDRTGDHLYGSVSSQQSVTSISANANIPPLVANIKLAQLWKPRRAYTSS